MTSPLPPLRKRLNKLRQTTNVELSVYERDYLLSFVLAAIGNVKPLSETIIFKGGTALRKCYFEDYRFSEDLDFSALPSFHEAELESALSEVCSIAANTIREHEPFEIIWQRVPEKAPHPKGQSAFFIRGKFPWHTGESTWARIKLEISADEQIYKPPKLRPIIHAYEEKLDAQILTYSLEEILAEKLRGLLQWAKRLDDKPFAKPRARDYYDLWEILSKHKAELDLVDFASFLSDKCNLKAVSFDNVESFFAPKVIVEARKNWENNLAHLVVELPPFDNVCEYLRVEIVSLIT